MTDSSQKSQQVFPFARPLQLSGISLQSKNKTSNSQNKAQHNDDFRSALRRAGSLGLEKLREFCISRFLSFMGLSRMRLKSGRLQSVEVFESRETSTWPKVASSLCGKVFRTGDWFDITLKNSA
jgi:hypothetical protein